MIINLFLYRTRYFSTPRKGHNPLQGRAYYQLLECLGVRYLHFFHPSTLVHIDTFLIIPSSSFLNLLLQVIRIHSPMRAERKQDWSDVPSKGIIRNAHAAALRLKKSSSGKVNNVGPFVSCKVWGTVGPDSSAPVSGSPDMSDTRKKSNYSKWEVLPFESLRREAQEHYFQMGGVSMYKMDGNRLDDLVCVRHTWPGGKKKKKVD